VLRSLRNRPTSVLQRTWHRTDTGDEPASFLVNNAESPQHQLKLGRRPQWIRLEVAGLSEINLGLKVLAADNDYGVKAGVIWIRFLNRQGEVLTSQKRLASGKNGHYRYLIPDATGEERFTLETPENCVELQLGFASWKSTSNSLAISNSLSVGQTVAIPVPRMATSSGEPAGILHIDSAQHGNLPLGLEPKWLSISTQEHKDLEGTIRVAGSESTAGKAGVIWVKFLNRAGEDVSSRLQIPTGQKGDYYYITPDAAGDFRFRLYAPEDCTSIRLGFAAWHASSSPTQLRNEAKFMALPAAAAKGLKAGIGPLRELSKPLLISRQESSADAAIPLTRSPKWLRVGVRGQQQLRVTVAVDQSTQHQTAKSALLLVDFRRNDGKTVTAPGVKSSESVGPYVYLDTTLLGTQSFNFQVPTGAVELRLGVRSWDAPEGRVSVRNRVEVEPAPPRPAAPNSEGGVPPVAESSISDQPRSPKDLKVAIICDEFTFNSFKYEFRPIILEPATWREQLEETQPDLFFCESAWSGVDSETRPWKGRIYSSSNFNRENRTELLEILEWCRENEVPSVFWNKEDPTHYPDRVHDFVDTAVRFDHVFTTDRNCVEKYKQDYGHNSVHCLPFATQPRLFNPINGHERTGEIIFAGSWYANHEARSQEMNTIFRQLMAAGMPVKIYDRFHGADDELHDFPAFLKEFTVPAVSHEQLASIYKSSKFGLNINTVTGSPTMFARRAFELMSSNTLVLSNEFAGAREFFGDTLVRVGDGHIELESLTDERVEELRDEALHNVLAHHTYEHRFREILHAVGFEYAGAAEEFTIVFPVSNRVEAAAALTTFNGLVTVASRVVLLLTNEIQGTEIREFYAEFNRYGVTVVSAALAASQDVEPESVVPGTHFAVLEPTSDVKPDELWRAQLHTAYIDGPIVIRSKQKYAYSSHHRLENLIAPREYLKTIVAKSGSIVPGDFYHV
jgi:spore maturation protein CgeB